MYNNLIKRPPAMKFKFTKQLYKCVLHNLVFVNNYCNFVFSKDRTILHSSRSYACMKINCIFIILILPTDTNANKFTENLI